MDENLLSREALDAELNVIDRMIAEGGGRRLQEALKAKHRRLFRAAIDKDLEFMAEHYEARGRTIIAQIMRRQLAHRQKRRVKAR